MPFVLGWRADYVRNVRDVVALLRQLCQVVPNIFDHGGKCLEALILLKLASLFTHPKLEGIHEDIGSVSASVLELFCHRDFEGFNAFFQDTLLLMQGKCSELAFMNASWH